MLVSTCGICDDLGYSSPMSLPLVRTLLQKFSTVLVSYLQIRGLRHDSSDDPLKWRHIHIKSQLLLSSLVVPDYAFRNRQGLVTCRSSRVCVTLFWHYGRAMSYGPWARRVAITIVNNDRFRHFTRLRDSFGFLGHSSLFFSHFSGDTYCRLIVLSIVCYNFCVLLFSKYLKLKWFLPCLRH